MIKIELCIARNEPTLTHCLLYLNILQLFKTEIYTTTSWICCFGYQSLQSLRDYKSSLVLYHFLHSFATVNLNSTLPFKDNLFTSVVYWCFSSYLLQLLFLPILFFLTYDPPLPPLRRTTCVTWSYDSCGRILDNLLFFAPN